MQLFVRTAPGQYELNFMWLPTWLGLNTTVYAELSRELEQVFVPGRVVDNQLLGEAEQVLYQFMARRFPDIEGLQDFLDGLKFVQVKNGRETG